MTTDQTPNGIDPALFAGTKTDLATDVVAYVSASSYDIVIPGRTFPLRIPYATSLSTGEGAELIMGPPSVPHSATNAEVAKLLTAHARDVYAQIDPQLIDLSDAVLDTYLTQSADHAHLAGALEKFLEHVPYLFAGVFRVRDKFIIDPSQHFERLLINYMLQ